MTNRSVDRRMMEIIKKFACPWLRIEGGSKHRRIRNTRSGDFLLVAGSASDVRAMRNFEATLRRLIEFGHGLIFSKTGRMPSAT